MFKNFVSDLTTLSKCEDKKVACVITDEAGTQVYAIGINGGAKGGADCLCKLDGSRYTCVHAEMNALAKCTASGPKVVVSSFSCCVTCAALMVNSGVTQFYYNEKYKSDAGLKILEDAGVYVKNISDEAAKQERVDTFIDVLRANGFLVINRENLRANEWPDIEQVIVEASKRYGYNMAVHATPYSITIEWRQP